MQLTTKTSGTQFVHCAEFVLFPRFQLDSMGDRHCGVYPHFGVSLVRGFTVFDELFDLFMMNSSTSTMNHRTWPRIPSTSKSSIKMLESVTMMTQKRAFDNMRKAYYCEHNIIGGCACPSGMNTLISARIFFFVGMKF